MSQTKVQLIDLGSAIASSTPTNGLFVTAANTVAISTNSVERLKISTSEVVFNDAGNDIDFRVEGDTNANLLFVDASTDRVGIGTSTVDELLHLKGASAANTILKVESTATAAERSSVNFFNGSVSRGRVGGSNDFDGLTLDSSTTESAAAIRFRTGGTSLTTKMTLTSGGSLGIGTTNPQLSFVCSNGGANGFEIDPSQSTGTITGINSFNRSSSAFTPLRFNASEYRWDTASTERARIDSSGRLLVGTSSARSNLFKAGVSALLQVEGVSGSDGRRIVNAYNSNDTGSSEFTFIKSRGTSLGSNTVVQSGDGLGAIYFNGTDGTSDISGASITAVVDGTPGANDMPGRLVFSTTADGASFPTEHFRITQKGIFKFSTNGSYIDTGSSYNEINQTNNSVGLLITNTNANPQGFQISYNTDSNGTGNEFIYCAGGVTPRMTVRSNGGIANYSANNVNLCDEREKKNIETLDSTWGCLKNWDLKKFHYNEDADTDDKRYGVIAQQIAPHCPEVITEWVRQKAEDAVLDEDGNVVTPAVEEVTRMAVKEQQMMWMAIKALQEAQTRIETLEAEVAALKAQ